MLFINSCDFYCVHVVRQLDKDLAMIEALRELKTELHGHKEVKIWAPCINSISLSVLIVNLEITF